MRVPNWVRKRKWLQDKGFWPLRIFPAHPFLSIPIPKTEQSPFDLGTKCLGFNELQDRESIPE
jgi:hypothetical protein